MPKETTYTFQGEFEITLDGNGVGEHTDLNAFLSAFKRTRRYHKTTVINGTISTTKQNLPAQPDWRLRFDNRKDKAIEYIKKHHPEMIIHNWWGRQEEKLPPDACAVLYGHGYGSTSYILKAHCSKEDCPCKKYGVESNGRVWDKHLFEFGPDSNPETGNMVVKFTDLGMQLLTELSFGGIQKDTIVGHINDKDAVDVIRDTLVGLHNLIGKVKFHD